MKKITSIGRIFFAIGMIGFCILILIDGDFVVARSMNPPPMFPGKMIISYFSGVVFLLTGLLIIIRKWSAIPALCCAIIIFIWGLSRNVPEAFSDQLLGGLWTNTFKAFAIGGGALILVASYAIEDRSPGNFFLPEGWTGNLITVGQFLIAMFLLLCGIQHFKFIDFVANFIPAYIPGHYFWAGFTGVALILAGIGLMIRGTAFSASLAAGIMLFLWVILLHIPMSVMDPGNIRSWTGVCEALTISGVLLILAGAMKNKSAYGLNKQGLLSNR